MENNYDSQIIEMTKMLPEKVEASDINASGLRREH